MKPANLRYALFVAVVLLITACSPSATPAATPTMTSVALPAQSTATVVSATSTPAPTETPIPPTATALPPTSTAAPPTNTPLPPTPTETPQQVGELQGSGLCFSPYYPVQEGVTWHYQSLSPISAPTEYSVTFSDVSANGFTAHQTYPDVQTETQWTCTESGLASIQFAQIALSQLPNFEIESVESTGVTLPPAENWQVGYKWDSAYQITGKMTLEGIGPVASNYDITTANEIVSVDEVTVPAGVYQDAMRVESNTTMIIQSKAGNVAIPPITLEFEGTNWHVKDVGLVKSEMVNEMGQFTTQLLSVE